MTQAKVRIMPGRRSGITSFPAYTGPQKTSAAFLQGDPVKIASGNLVAVTKSSSATSSIYFVKKSSTANVVGFAEGLAVASKTSDIVVTKITEGQEFAGNLLKGTASSAKVSKVGSTVYLGQVSGETHWGWSLTAPGASSASYVQGKITGLIDAASTVNGRVLVTPTKGGALFV